MLPPVAKKDGFGTTGVDELMASIGLLAGDEDSPPDHVVQRLRSYLSSYHATHPETGCVLPALGPEIARADPEVRATVDLRHSGPWTRSSVSNGLPT